MWINSKVILLMGLLISTKLLSMKTVIWTKINIRKIEYIHRISMNKIHKIEWWLRISSFQKVHKYCQKWNPIWMKPLFSQWLKWQKLVNCKKFYKYN